MRSMDKDKREPEKSKGRPRTTLIHRFLPFCREEIYCRKVLILVAVSAIIAVLVTPSFTSDSPPFRLGDIADRNVKAKRDFFVEDEAATGKQREEAVRRSPIIYDLDENIAASTFERVGSAFQAMREFLSEDRYPFPRLEMPRESVFGSGFGAGDAAALPVSETAQQTLRRKKDFENILGLQISSEVFSSFLEKGFGKDLQDRLVQLLKTSFEQGIVSGKAWMNRDAAESVVIRKAGTSEEHLVHPPYSYPDLEEARKLMVMQALDQGHDIKEMIAFTSLATQLLQSNLHFNFEETESRRERAYIQVKPVLIKVMKNEMLVREGQRVGQDEILKLKAHQSAGTERHWLLVFVSLFLFCVLCIWVVVHVARQHLPYFRMEYQDLLFLAILLVLLISLGRVTMSVAGLIGDASANLTANAFIYAIPLSAGAMMACIFFGVTVSLIFSLVLTLFAGMLFGKDFGLFFYFMIGSFVAAHGVSPCRNRMIPIKAGLLVGCANVVLILLSAYLQDQWIFLRVLTNAFFGFCGGIFAGILVTGLTPLVEMAFNYTTDIKLLELATMDQPLLRELMVEAPGTYHHSIIVGNMVEAAAKSIGANSLLAKVAAYYHDIGKIKKPLYFIENQFECENRHEKLAPSMSSLILISHVKEGAEMARQSRLGKDIINIISQHHGKSFISFFYNKAMEAREKSKTSKGALLPPINMDDYRYPGPKPQTKEAGLVMLADVVEAACRSLTEPTPARIQGLVHRLINNIFSDGQLDECELTLKDLHQIAKHFNQILATIHHKRIEYPGVSASEGKGRADAVDPNQREAKPDRDKQAANKERGKPDLKRLGIH